MTDCNLKASTVFTNSSTVRSNTTTTDSTNVNATSNLWGRIGETCRHTETHPLCITSRIVSRSSGSVFSSPRITSLAATKTTSHHPSVLWHCWFGNRKGILRWLPVKVLPQQFTKIYFMGLPALFYSSVNHTNAPDWLSRCCGDEINWWTNKTTPSPHMTSQYSHFEFRNTKQLLNVSWKCMPQLPHDKYLSLSSAKTA